MNQDKWMLIEKSGHYTKLCRKRPEETKGITGDILEVAAIWVSDKWVRIQYPILSKDCRIIRDVPVEEAVAIILRAGL